MKLNRTGSNWNRLERNKINENWDIIEGNHNKLEGEFNDVVGKITDEVVGHLVDSAKLDWKEPVDTVEDLPENAEVGETRMVREADPDGISYVYRYDGEKWERIQAIDVTLVNEVDVRLSERINEINNRNKTIGVSKKTIEKIEKGIVTFITDDARTADWLDYKDLFASKGAKWCTAVVPTFVGQSGYLNKEQLLTLQNDYGVEILSHSYTHPYLPTLPDSEAEDEFKLSKRWFDENGFNVESFAYPQGHYGLREKRFARKYFRSARQSGRGDFGYNTFPLSSFELFSVWLDLNVTSQRFGGYEGNTFEFYKYLIDEVNKNGGWLIISSHSWNTKRDGLLPLYEQVIDYAIENSEVLTLSEALDRVGNVIEIGTENKETPFDKYFSIGHDSSIRSNLMNSLVITNKGSYDGNNPITNFENLKITINTLNKQEAENSGLPPLAGSLLTYRNETQGNTRQHSYQVYRTIPGEYYYRNIIDEDRTWGEWKPIRGARVSKIPFGATIDYFPIGLTMSHYHRNEVGQFPINENISVITNKADNDDFRDSFQLAKSTNNDRLFIRSAHVTGDSWQEWVEITGRTVFGARNEKTLNTPIQDFQLGRTSNPITGSKATEENAPEGKAGTLITYKNDNSDHGFNYQTYQIYRENTIYRRSFTVEGQPNSWVKIIG